MAGTYFTWRGKNSLTDYNMQVLDDVDFSVPETSYEFVDIPGLNRDYIIDRDKMQGIVKTIPVRIRKKMNGTSFDQQVREIITWLKGYTQGDILPRQMWEDLFFSGYPDVVYKAMFYEGITTKDTMNNRDSVILYLKFKCQPFAYLVSGMTPIDVPNPTTGGSTSRITLSGDLNKRFDTPFNPLITCKINGNSTFNTCAISWYTLTSPIQLIKSVAWKPTTTPTLGTITLDFDLGVAYGPNGEDYGFIFILGNQFKDMTLSGGNQLIFQGLLDVQVIPRYQVVAM